MIHPSYVDLMKVMNSGVEFGEVPVVNSPRADDEEKVGRKAVHERRNDADPGIHP